MDDVLGSDLGWGHCICFTNELNENNLLHCNCKYCWSATQKERKENFLSLCSQGSRESLCSEMPVRNKCVNIMTGSTGFSYPCTRGQSRSVSLLFLSAAFLFEALLFTRRRLGLGQHGCCAVPCSVARPTRQPGLATSGHRCWGVEMTSAVSFLSHVALC